MPNLRHLTKRELEELKENCILNTELSRIALLLSKGQSIVQISMETGLSEAGVSRRIREIKDRIARV